MKSLGIIRYIDHLGRIVIPKEIRDTLDIQDKDPVEIYTEGDSILLRKHQLTCIFCGKGASLSVYKNKPVCADCISDLSDIQ